MNRLKIFQGFINTIVLPADTHIGYENDSVYKPGIEETYLRVFLGSTHGETLAIGRGCNETITNCESTIEIVTPSMKGLSLALDIEDAIMCAAKEWPSNKMIVGNNSVSSGNHFMEKLTRSVLPVKIKYRIIKAVNCNE